MMYKKVIAMFCVLLCMALCGGALCWAAMPCELTDATSNRVRVVSTQNTEKLWLMRAQYAGDKLTNVQSQSVDITEGSNTFVFDGHVTAADSMKIFLWDSNMTPYAEALDITSEWVPLPMRSQEEYNLGMPGGEGEQFMQSMTRSLKNPDVLYLAHDVEGSWRSADGGKSWNKNKDYGLYVKNGQSIMADPVAADTVFIIVDEGWLWPGKVREYEGLYKSTDGGSRWELVLNTIENPERVSRSNIAYAYAPTDSREQSPRIWYAAFGENGLFRSDACGNAGSWQKVAGLDARAFWVVVDPSDEDIVYVCTDNGLYRSTDGGNNLAPWKLAGKEVSSAAINPDTGKIYAASVGDGLYTMEVGAEFVRQNVTIPVAGNITNKIQRLVMNPGYPQQIYFIARDGKTAPVRSCVSEDGGATWKVFEEATTFPGMGRETGWRRWIDGDFGIISPNPANKTDASAMSRSTMFRLEVGASAVRVYESAAGFIGNAPAWWSNSIAFHPYNPDMLGFFCMDVGPRISANGGDWFIESDPNITKWKYGYPELIQWTGSYAGAFQPAEGSEIVVASIGGYNGRAQLMRSENLGRTWTLLTSSAADTTSKLHGYEFIGFDPNDPNCVFAGYQVSHDAGKTFSPIAFPAEYYKTPGTELVNQHRPFVAGLSAADGKTYVFALDRDMYYVLRSEDQGQTWIEFCDLRDFRGRAKFVDLPVFAAHPSDPSAVYALSQNHDLLKVVRDEQTGDVTAENLNVYDMLPDWVSEGVHTFNQIADIAFDPVDNDVMYVSLLAAGVPNVYGSTDGGKTWRDVSEGLPCAGGGILAVNPHTRELYRGTTAGVYKRQGIGR